MMAASMNHFNDIAASRMRPGAFAVAVVSLLLLACAVGLLASRPHARTIARRPLPAAWPATFAWTWDRDDDLRFLSPDVGVAAVQLSIELEGRETRVRANHGVLVTQSAAFVLPVVHVDAFERWRPALDAAQEDALVRAIVDVAAHSRVGAVQVDFEALPSQRAFYRRVLARVRSQLPTTVISITALASWCLADRWTSDLPVDDVVAMAFRLGHDARVTRRAIDGLARWPADDCASTGIATDEAALRLPAHRTLFLFSPRPWTAAAWQSALAPNASNS